MELKRDGNRVPLAVEGNDYNHITLAAPTTTLVKSGKGILSRIIVNKAAADGVISVHDGLDAAGPVIALITMPATLLQSSFSIDYGVEFSTGLTIVTSTAAQDITVAFI